jgi:hypothetical protein
MRKLLLGFISIFAQFAVALEFPLPSGNYEGAKI